ncbi:MAG: glycoside hydrolase family 31 protein [Chitinophagales bacterium]
MSNRNESLGAFVAAGPRNSGIEITATNGILLVEVYQSGIVRVRISKQEERQFSYAVCVRPEACQWEYTESEEFVQIKTAWLQLRIQKNPLRLSFYSADGRLLNEDDKAFGTSWIGTEVTTYKTLQSGERFIGLGEKTGPLDRRGNAYVNWNTDKFAYSPDQDPLYMTVPFYIGIHQQTQYGIFFDNSFKSKFNFGASNHRFSFFGAEDGVMDYYFFHAEDIAGILKGYTWLTGRQELPPIWSLGLQQCRYSYYPDKEVLHIARTFREKQIPCDMIYLDIHYMDGYKVFSFDPQRFPDPAGMVKSLQEQGFHTTVILDPGVREQPGYLPYDTGLREGHFATYPDGVPFTGDVWPGTSCFPDFTQEKTRLWWGEQLQYYTQLGIDGFWNDMNEPAMWGQSPPDLFEFDFDGARTTHKQARNVYGMQMARSTYDGAKWALKGQRPFVLNRAGFSGVQRYTASWTGDNVASDEHMICGVRLVTSLGLSGIPFAGYDVGGFAGEASPNLFARWIVLGALSPLFRCHSMINSKDAEPWSFGEEAEEIARHYIELRYRLLPYVYSLFYEASQSGMPIARSLAIQYAHDPMVFDRRFENQYSFGDAILVPVVESHRDMIKVYLPEGLWYDWHNDQAYPSGILVADVRSERYPLFVRAGSLIPMQNVVQHTAEHPGDTLEIHVYAGADGKFEYYEDDGTTYAYQQHQFFKREIVLNWNQSQLCFKAAIGSSPSKFSKLKLVWHQFGTSLKVTLNGKPLQVEPAVFQLVPPVSNFDPFYTATANDMHAAVQTTHCFFTSEELKFDFVHE